MKPKLLVIDDDHAHRSGMALLLSDAGLEIDEAESGEQAITMIRRKAYDLVITDYKMHEINGMELLKLINDFDPLLKVIMVTGHGSIEHAVEAIHLGATDYITKPVDPQKLKTVIQQALKIPADAAPSAAVPDRYVHFGEIIGKSKAIRQVITKINEVAPIDVPVLITGESGTGKELVARAIHSSSPRKPQPFIAVNTGAIPKDLISSELFGHEKGSFTGAVDQKKGKFEEANNGTLFLDEISTMSAQVQISLLRVLENSTIDRVGGRREIPINVRVVAASNENLDEIIEQGKFRADLYYRLNVFAIELPPLRDRKEDIPILCDYFLERFNQEYKRTISGFEPAAMELMTNYSWPGNIRELRNVVLRAMISAKSTIAKKHLPATVVSGSNGTQEIRFRAGTPLNDIERESIIQTLKKVKGNKLKAAELLNISRRSLYNKLEEYKISDDEFSV